jgi:hypothetical protein
MKTERDEPERLFGVPGKMNLRIEALYAWVVEEPEGGEGLPVINVRGHTMPLVGADLDRIKSMRSFAEKTRRETGWPVRLVRFGAREDLEELP